MAAAARVAVVGGGLAGLAAATRLKDSGFHVELFERSRLLGGRATSFEVQGHLVDNGQHVYLACCRKFIAFVEAYGPPGALKTQDRFDVTVFSKDGRRSRLRAAPLRAPLHVIASFAAYRFLSWSGKLQIARALTALRRGEPRPEETFLRWLQRQRQSVQTIRAFWEPFIVPALNAPLDRMSAADAAFVLRTAFLSDAGAARFGYSTVPLARIMEHVAARLDAVHRSTPVLALDATPTRVTLTTPQRTDSFDCAVIATSPHSLARLLPERIAQAVPPLDAYEPYAIMDAHIWYDGAPLDVEFAAILDSPVQWIFQKAPGYLCCSMSDAGELVRMPGDDVVQLAWREISAAVPLRAARFLRGAATRNPEGTFLARPGMKRPAANTPLPNVALAGAWTSTGWPDTMESAVRSGIAAARVLLNCDLAMRESAVV